MINDKELLSIVDKYGTPIYVIDESELDKNKAKLEDAFSNLPVPVTIAYPYKVNALNLMLEYMYKIGRWAEVASEPELDMALKTGLTPNNIIINAPYKSLSLLSRAINVGCKIHVDNEYELYALVRLIDQVEYRGIIDLGLRISCPGNTLWSRFGFRDDEVLKAINIIKGCNNIRITGLHIHRSSIADLQEYRKHIKYIFMMARLFTNNYGIGLDYLDIGSGFAIDWPKPIKTPGWSAPSLNEYANIVRDSLFEYRPDIHHIIVEPGRSSVASSGSFLSKVVSIKERGDKKFIICDGALNFIPGAEIYKYRISRVGPGQNGRNKNIATDDVLCGCLCDSLDILDTEVNIRNPKIGQILKIEDVGGYDIARSFIWQLNYPPIIWVSQNSHHITHKQQ